MKKYITTSVIGTAIILLTATSAVAGYPLNNKVGDIDTKFVFFGFAQIDAVGGEGMKIKETVSSSQAKTNLAFRGQCIRLGWKYFAGNIRGKVFLDFNQSASGASDHTNGAAIPKVVKDAFISYVFDPGFVVKAGLIKMPNGMSFTVPGAALNIAERGFDKALVLERNTGIMLSGRDMGLGNDGKVNGLEMGHERPWQGFGYDVMIANQASRSKMASSSPMGGVTLMLFVGCLITLKNFILKLLTGNLKVLEDQILKIIRMLMLELILI